MLDFGPIAFASPWLLLGLLALPALWWLLRVLPPAPRRVPNPVNRLLAKLRRTEQTPAHTPLWLILLRLVLAGLVILAVAHPLMNPATTMPGSGPLVLVVDDGWAAARNWTERETALSGLIDRAERTHRPVLVLTTAKPPGAEPLAASKLMRPAEARRMVRAIQPKPWPDDRTAAAKALDAVKIEGAADLVWLSDGLDGSGAAALADKLRRLGTLQVYTDPALRLARLVLPPVSEANDMAVPLERASAGPATPVAVRALDENGKLLVRQEGRFPTGATKTEVRLTVPSEIRNDIIRIEIEGEASAGASVLLDERWRRRPVGLFSGETTERAQPLLSDLYYLQRALSPFSEVRRGNVDDLLKRKLAVLVLADVGRLTETQEKTLAGWVDGGGVLLRFAGPRLAKDVDALVPVRLRQGGRELGGVMSWERPAQLMPFEKASPFYGLSVPPDVLIQRQVLAEPSLDLDSKTWARLTDGTPLVTAEKRGKGWIVLVHTTANTDWSNLPISGLFVQMLQRIVGLSQGVAGEEGSGVLAPVAVMDGFGRMQSPPSTAAPIEGAKFAEAVPGPRTPPGYYGRQGARRALNLSPAIGPLKPLAAALPDGVVTRGFPEAGELDLKPWLLLAALLLAFADIVIGYILRGLVPGVGAGRGAKAAGRAAAVAVVVIGALAAPAQAQEFDSPQSFALKAALETRLAYVETGSPAVDKVSREGLHGLSEVLRRRTAVEPGAPMGVNVETDVLAFFPMLYWAVSPSQPPLSDAAIEKLQNYLRTGGTILFDTREQGELNADPSGSGGPAGLRLRYLLRGLDIPALIPVPADHVLTKSFYLLSKFPGRWDGGTVWVEAKGNRYNDGVSSVVIGSNDWAGAWAVDDDGQPLYPVVPGGERQREMAYRFGVNWVMYALTGNYKTDQVHVPAIMERLGQ